MHIEKSVNYGYGMNANISYTDLFLDVRVYIEISVNYGFGMNANITSRVLSLC